MMADVYDNKHLFVFKGGEPHPFLDAKDEDGISLNEKFRAIHDYFGHAIEGNEFGPIGEERAWLAHSQMFSPLARKAMTTETRGQNSWVNNSDVNKNALEKFKRGNELIAIGEVAEGQKLVNEAKSEFVYAVQKVDLLPDEYVSIDEYYEATNEETTPQQSVVQQLKDFGVSEEMAKPVTNVVTKIFEGLKKAGLVAAEKVEDWVGIGKGKVDEKALKQIIGEVGAENLPKVKANLQVARQMEAEGKTPKEIWLATGWQRTKDKGKWKYDLPDLDFKIGSLDQLPKVAST